jgi:SPP1 family predicted phage head-tail adaptor
MRSFIAPLGKHFGEVGEAPTGSGLLADAQQDTLDFLDEWGETMTLKRKSTSYDGLGKATVTWVTITTFVGDWQTLPGSIVQEEQGLKVKSDAQVITAYNQDIRQYDRVYRQDGTYEYVNYIRKYEDHLTIRVTRTQGE